MRYSAGTLSRLRTVAVTLFVVVGILLFALLWAKSGGSIPGVTGHGYKINAQFSNIENLAHASDVDMAGVPIGTVENLGVIKNGVDVNMVLHRYGPLHQGATVQIQDKTLINETFVEITDGHGPKLPSGSTLPLSAAQNYTSLNTLFNGFPKPTQDAAKQLLTSFNSATTGQAGDVSNLVGDLANVGSQGQTVFDVLSSQTSDLQQLVRQTGTLLAVLDEGQGQIGDLATSAEAVSQATAQSSKALSQSVQDLPGVINSAHAASGSVETLSAALSPVATNLQRAAPTLNRALITLPGTTRALRSVLPSLNNALADAPATLKPLPTTAQDLTNLLPSTANVLSNLNPVVSYLDPYHQDVGAFFSNFNAAGQAHHDTNSYFADVQLITIAKSAGLLGIVPADLQTFFGSAATNPYPGAGTSAAHPAQPFSGKYPSVPQEKY